MSPGFSEERGPRYSEPRAGIGLVVPRAGFRMALTSSSSVKYWLSLDLEQGRNPDLPSTQVSFL